MQQANPEQGDHSQPLQGWGATLGFCLAILAKLQNPASSINSYKTQNYLPYKNKTDEQTTALSKTMAIRKIVIFMTFGVEGAFNKD